MSSSSEFSSLASPIHPPDISMWQNNIDPSGSSYFGYPSAEYGLDGSYDNTSLQDFSSSYAQSSAAPSEYEASQPRRHTAEHHSSRAPTASRRKSTQSTTASYNQYDRIYADSNFSPPVEMDFFSPTYPTNGQDYYPDFAAYETSNIDNLLAPTASDSSNSTEQSMPASPLGVSDAETSNSSIESTPARNHALYSAYPSEDGLYHCPFAARDNCGHEPKNLKCEYDKYIDSHLKPFRCKSQSCADQQFSSTACLLRHEREAHDMHGHNESLCEYPPCNRSLPGNGFRRSYNCKDHMTRCHGWIDSNPPENSKGKRRAAAGTKSSGITKSKQKKQHIQLLHQQFAEHKAYVAELSARLDPLDPSFAMYLTKLNGAAQMLKTIQSEINKLQGRG